jgi:hypothetical protein
LAFLLCYKSIFSKGGVQKYYQDHVFLSEQFMISGGFRNNIQDHRQLSAKILATLFKEASRNFI